MSVNIILTIGFECACAFASIVLKCDFFFWENISLQGFYHLHIYIMHYLLIFCREVESTEEQVK